MWEILIFKCFLPLKLQINSEKPGLEGKITWANGTGHTSMSQVRPKITLKKNERKKKRDRRTSTLLYDALARDS